MSDIKLFRVSSGKANELQSDASDLEKPLQTLIEKNLDTLLGISFLATEYSTGKTHAGRIDTLGLDENHCPVIIEYKRSMGESVINQGLFYLDWLMDHKAEFKLLVMETLSKSSADTIDWSAPRLVCIAADFTKYDGHAVRQIARNIELIRYRRFGDDFLLLELANATSANNGKSIAGKAGLAATGKAAVAIAGAAKQGGDKSYAELLQTLPAPLAELLASLEDYVMSLGDDVQRKELKLYAAFKRLKNFATVVLQKNRLLLYLHLDAAQWADTLPGGRDVSQQGHWGTGDLEISLSTQADLDAAKPLIVMAYDGRAAVPSQVARLDRQQASDDGSTSPAALVMPLTPRAPSQ